MPEQGYLLSAAAVRRLSDTVKRLERELAILKLRRPAAQTHFRPCILVQLGASLSAGSSATATVYRWTGSAWSSLSETLTVRDYRTSGAAIASGKRCVCVPIGGEWWVISTQC